MQSFEGVWCYVTQFFFRSFYFLFWTFFLVNWRPLRLFHDSWHVPYRVPTSNVIYISQSLMDSHVTCEKEKQVSTFALLWNTARNLNTHTMRNRPYRSDLRHFVASIHLWNSEYSGVLCLWRCQVFAIFTKIQTLR